MDGYGWLKMGEMDGMVEIVPQFALSFGATYTKNYSDSMNIFFSFHFIYCQKAIIARFSNFDIIIKIKLL